MQETVKVAVDAMGGDHAPAEIIRGVIDAVNARRDIKVILIGRQKDIEDQLRQYTYSKEQIEHAIEKCGFSATVRGEALTLEQFAALANAFSCEE